MLALSLCLAASTLVFHVEDARGVAADETAEVVGLLVAGAVRLGAAPAANDSASLGLECAPDTRCAAAVAALGAGAELVSLRLVGIPTRIRVIAEREAQRVEMDLGRERAGWGPRLDLLLRELFAERLPSAKVEPARAAWAPWVILGASAVSASLGIAFGVDNYLARRTAAVTTDPALVRELDVQAETTGIAANALFVTSGVGVATAIVWWLLD